MRLPRAGSPIVRNRSHTITAEIEVPAGGAEGVIVSDGGVDGGYSLCLLDGRLHYVSNFLGRAHSVVSSPLALPPGPHTVVVEFERAGQQTSLARLLIDGAAAGEIAIPRTNPFFFAVAEGLEVGSDSTSAVWPAYDPPFLFTGTIRQVTIEVLRDAPAASAEGAAAQDRADMVRQ
jgi:arylsulfatase